MAGKLTVGLAAHVDAGKTTLSEAMLFLSGAVRRQGRVDHGDAFQVQTYNIHPALTSGGREGVFAQTADGAYPVFRDVFPGRAGFDTAFGIANFRIIDIAAGTFILHGLYFLSFFWRKLLFPR